METVKEKQVKWLISSTTSPSDYKEFLKGVRIGNYFDSAQDQMGNFVTTITQWDFTREHPRYFNPIPLNEEWLLKFGFGYERQTIGGWERWEIRTKKDRHIKILDKKFSWGVGEYTDHILYVHQLQNLYFALTGEELSPL